MKEQTITRVGIMQRAWALLLAAALCLGLMPATAWAEGNETTGTAPESTQVSVGTATLTIVQGVAWDGPVALVNKTYEFAGKATVEDMFAAAKEAGDIKDYAFNSSGYLDSITTASGVEVKALADWSSYWSIYKNNNEAGYDKDNPNEGKNIDVLTDGDALQFAWCDSTPNIAPTADQWRALTREAASSSGVAGDTSAAQGGKVTVTIVQGVGYAGPAALLNKTYTFNKNATVEDLFKAAKVAGDIRDYAFVDSFGTGSAFLSSLTSQGDSAIGDSTGWWSSFVNNAMDNDGSKTAAASPLADGDALQFAWCDSTPNIAPTADQWKTLSAVATPGGATAEGEVSVNPSPSTSQVDAATLDSSLNTVYRTLFANLAGTLEGSGGSSERNVSSWKAMEAAAIGQVNVVDADAAIADAAASYNTPKDNSLQRSIIVLTALGIDATKVPSNLVEKLANDQSAVTAYPTSAAFALLAYASGSYEVAPDATNSARALIDKLAAAQSSAGGYLAMGSIDVDTTAMVIPALAAYQGDTTAKAALDKAVAALRSTQQNDGSFGNVNSTAVAIIALCSVGIDPASEDEWIGLAATPLKALLSSAKEDMTGFSVATGMKEDMVNEQGFRALVAYQGLKSTGAAYNVYTQAKLGQAVLPVEKQQGSDSGSVSAAATDKKALAQTGDSTLPLTTGVATLALGALVAGITATRRSVSKGRRI